MIRILPSECIQNALHSIRDISPRIDKPLPDNKILFIYLGRRKPSWEVKDWKKSNGGIFCLVIASRHGQHQDTKILTRTDSKTPRRLQKQTRHEMQGLVSSEWNHYYRHVNYSTLASEVPDWVLHM